MKKIIAVACFSLAVLGFNATSALAANSVTGTSSSVISAGNMKNDAVTINLFLVNQKIISHVEWNANLMKIVSAKTEQEIKSVYDSLVYKVATTPFYQ